MNEAIEMTKLFMEGPKTTQQQQQQQQQGTPAKTKQQQQQKQQRESVQQQRADVGLILRFLHFFYSCHVFSGFFLNVFFI